jgi:peptidoglycan/LPS O-acetylase OafA/YrhL
LIALPAEEPESASPADAPPPARSPLAELLAGPLLPALDGLRMVAVMIVVLYHVGYQRVPADLGVSVFFVLSGFLITWLLLKEHAKTGTIALKTFYLRRLFRLLPAYYVFLGVALAVYFGRGHAAHRRTDFILPSLLYYANYFNAFHNHPATPISHTWSLAVEEQFYVVWPLAFSFVMPRGRRAVARFLAASIGLSFTWRAFLFGYLHVGTAYVNNAFDTRFGTLAIGCLAAVLTGNPRFVAAAEAISRRSIYVVVTLLLLIGSRMMPAIYHYSVGLTVEAMLIATAILQIMQLASRPAFRWLSHPAARYIGTVSYPMYLYHGLCNSAVAHVLPGATLLRFAAVLALSIAVGTMSFYLVEKPFLRLRKRLTG